MKAELKLTATFVLTDCRADEDPCYLCIFNCEHGNCPSEYCQVGSYFKEELDVQKV